MEKVGENQEVAQVKVVLAAPITTIRITPEIQNITQNHLKAG